MSVQVLTYAKSVNFFVNFCKGEISLLRKNVASVGHVCGCRLHVGAVVIDRYFMGNYGRLESACVAAFEIETS